MRRLAVALLVLGWVAPAFVGRSLAATATETSADRVKEFALPAQPAARALLAFAQQTQLEVLFSFDALRDVSANEVVGRFTPAEAMTELLRGTGFAARRNGGGRFIVGPAPRTGEIHGVLGFENGAPAPNVRIRIVDTALAAKTNALGEFRFTGVPAGAYELVALPRGGDAHTIRGVTVVPGETTRLPAQLLAVSDGTSRLAPFLVNDKSTRRDPFDRSEAPATVRTAGSNLDLARTENDALPFAIYNRDQIARSGVVNLNEFLQRELLDSDASTKPPEQDGSQPTFAAGSTNLNLRGFGADETIVLVNGRRLPEALTSGSGTLPPDVNFIPLSLVQQVEVLPVSAASLYSGNAVGGVINIVLRPGVDAEATELALTYTNATADYDAAQTSASLLHSRSLLGGALRMRFNASFTRSRPATEQELRLRSRHQPRVAAPWDAAIYRATPNIRAIESPAPPIAEAGTGESTPPASPAPLSLFGPGGAAFTSVAPGSDGRGGLAAFAGRQGVRNFDYFDAPGGLATSLDSIDYPYGREQQRAAYFASATVDVAPWLQLGFDGIYTRTVQHRGYDVLAADLRLAADSPLNPFGQDAMVSLNELAPALGENHSEARLEFASAVLSGLFKLPADWRLVLDGQYGRNLAKYRGLAGASYARWQELVDQGIYNPLRDTQVFGPPPEFYDRVLIHRGAAARFVTLGDYATIDAAVRLTHHTLPFLTGNAVLNAGADYRHNELAPHVDERRFADGSLADEPVRWEGRTLERYSLFGELQAPLLPRERLPAAVRSLDGDLAVRYLASNQSNETSVAPTFAFRAQFERGFALRGSLSTSSRYPAPQMSRLALPSTNGGDTIGVDLKNAYDPVQGFHYAMLEDEILDPALDPEEAVTQTAGVVWRGGRRHRFRLSVDFVHTRKANELVPLDVQTILNLEHLFPERVLRKRGPDGQPGVVQSVHTGTINSAWRRSDHWSAMADYAWTECAGGTLELYARVLHYSRYDRLLLPGAQVVDELQNPDGGNSGLLKHRAKFGAGWSNRAHALGVDGHYFHSRILPAPERPGQGRDRISAYWQFDAYAQTDLTRWLPWVRQNIRLQLRVNNVLGLEFPRYANASSGAGVQPYGDWRGRVYSLSLSSSF